MIDKDTLLRRIEEQKKAELAWWVFGVPAIEDYIVARWAYVGGLKRQYYWSASQVFEKLLKLVWVDLGWDTRKVGHKIRNLSSRLIDDAGCQSLVEPFKSRVSVGRSGDPGANSPFEYICQVERYGNPNVRYNNHKMMIFMGDIHRFDESVFRIVGDLGSIGSLPSPGQYFNFDYSFEHTKLSDELNKYITLGNQQIGRNAEEIPFALSMRRSPVEDAASKPSYEAAWAWLSKLARLPDRHDNASGESFQR